MILLCGIPSETPLALVADRLETMGTPYRMLSQRRCLDSTIEFAVDSAISGRLVLDGETIPLEQCTGIYLRIMDDAALPEIRDEPPESPRRAKARAWHEALNTWCEIAPGRVVNRSSTMGSNASKPYQSQVIMSQGFRIPETLVTSDPEAVAEFRARHGRVVFKSMSGVRSIVRELDDDDLRRLDAIRWCPVQFQAFVPGENVRVHVVGEEIFATAIRSEATDYRYAQRQVGEAAELVPTTLDDESAEHCVALARALDLPFAGIDLKITPEGDAYCFEVNPSPGYSYYEQSTGQEISLAVARHLRGR